MDDTATRATWSDGARAAIPLLLGIVPFGLIFGVTAVNADVPPIAAWASSFIVFAGASQIAIVEVLDSGGAAIVAFVTAVVINARLMMYSADLARYTTTYPMAARIPLSYLMTDQAYLLTVHRFPSPGDHTGMLRFYFGAALTFWTTWQITTTSGMVLGTAVPESWSLEFAIPLTFMALLVLAVRDRPQLVAAIVGGGVALAGVGLPYSFGLLIGAAAGVAAGMAAARATP